jgi:hypothetical protein
MTTTKEEKLPVPRVVTDFVAKIPPAFIPKPIELILLSCSNGMRSVARSE